MLMPSNDFNNNMRFNNNMQFNPNNNLQFNNMPFNNNFGAPIQNQIFNMNNNMIMNNMPQNFPNMNNNNGMLIQPSKDIKLNKILNISSIIPINKCKDKYTEKQFDEITKICMVALKDNVDDLPKFCVEKIKEKLKGQWFVLVRNIKDNNNFEFGFSLQIKYKDIIIFRCCDIIFYVSSI